MLDETTYAAHVEAGRRGLEEALDDLVKIVNREVEIFQELINALTAQYHAVIQEEMQMVQDSTSKVEKLVQATRSLEKDRIRRTVEVSDHLGLDASKPALSEIIPLVESQYSVRLKELRTMLLSLSTRVRDTNLRNKRLLNNALRTVNKSMRVLAGARKGHGSYNEKGKEEFSSHELLSIQT